MQGYLNLGDWRGLELPSNDKRRKESIKLFELSTSVWTNWANLKETLADLQPETEGDEEGTEDNSSTVAKHKRQPEASPNLHRRTLAGGAQHLWKNFAELMRSKENDSLTKKHVDPVLLGLIKSMQGVWEEKNPLGLKNW